MNFSFWLTFAPLLLVNAFFLSAFVVFIFISRNRPKTQEIEDRHASIILGKWIREFWFWVTDPVFQFLVKNRVAPNAITIAGCVLALFSALAFAFGFLGLGGWLMVFGASLDFFDGRVARATNRSTLAGSFVDSVLDRVSEGLVLSGIAFHYRNSFVFWIVMAVYLGSVMTSYTKARGEVSGVSYGGGMMQRPERIAYMGAGAILTPLIAYFLFSKNWFTLSVTQLENFVYFIPLIIVAILSNMSAFHRLVKIMKLLDEKAANEK